MNAVRPPGPATLSNRGAWLLRWRPGERKTVYLSALVFGASAFLLLFYVQFVWAQYSGRAPGHPPAFGDFFALWSYGKIAGAHPAAELYDFAALQARQVALGMDPSLHKCPSGKALSLSNGLELRP